MPTYWIRLFVAIIAIATMPISATAAKKSKADLEHENEILKLQLENERLKNVIQSKTIAAPLIEDSPTGTISKSKTVLREIPRLGNRFGISLTPNFPLTKVKINGTDTFGGFGVGGVLDFQRRLNSIFAVGLMGGYLGRVERSSEGVLVQNFTTRTSGSNSFGIGTLRLYADQFGTTPTYPSNYWEPFFGLGAGIGYTNRFGAMKPMSGYVWLDNGKSEERIFTNSTVSTYSYMISIGFDIHEESISSGGEIVYLHLGETSHPVIGGGSLVGVDDAIFVAFRLILQ